MSENDDPQPDEKPPVGDPQDPDPKPEEFDRDQAMAKIKKANQEAASLRARLKDLEPLAAKVKEMEDAKKTEVERFAEERDTYKTKASETEIALLRLEVALDNAPEGMDLKQVRKLAKRLAGSSLEEMQEDAEELFSTFTPKDKDNKDEDTTRRPKERLRPGAVPDAEPEETDPAKLAALVPRSSF